MTFGQFLVTAVLLINTFCNGAVPVFVNPDPLGGTTLSIAEDTSVGTTIYTLLATDPDGDPLTYGKFTGVGFDVISPDSVVTTQTFSVAIQSTHSITVSAFDGTSTTYMSMSITLTAAVAANPNSPVFLPTLYATNIPENTASGTSVQALTCSDVESTTCTLAIQSGDDASNKFTISGNNVQTTSTAIDYDSMSGQSFLYTLVITGVDTPGSPSSANTATATVYVTVTSQNDNTPSISGPSTSTVSEDSAAGTTVCTMTASDADYGDDGTLSFSIVGGNTGGLFGVSSSSGVVYLAGTLDFEITMSHELVIKVSDGGNSVLTATSTVTITVTDVNDNSPTCSSAPYVFSVNEQTSATPVTVTTLACTDGDAGTSLQYAIASGNSDTCFALDALTGVLTTACTLDYDTGSQHYALVTTVTDGTFTTTVTLAVNLVPVNDITPSFGSSTTVTIAESSSAGTAILTYTAADSDASPHNIEKYEITSVTNSGSSFFMIDMTSAVIYLSQAVDFETSQNYVLILEATDGGSLTGTGTVTVSVTDVNDNTPSCTPTAHVTSVSEDAALNAVVIADLSCSDGDAGTSLVYSVTSRPVSTHFAVSETGGVASLVVNSALDYETTSYYVLAVSVSDGGTSSTVSVVVNVGNVNEAGPVFNPVTYAVAFSESTSVSSVLATVTATDADTDTITYSFVTSYTGFAIDSAAASAGAAALIGVATLAAGIVKLRKVSSLTSGSAKLTKVGQIKSRYGPKHGRVRQQKWTLIHADCIASCAYANQANW
ncbi:Cadherin EGF LAG seven-pass G-type receptor 3 [Mizuhopecten yessoensis]|uniref:Cadherin EGF LAG seven-pass G-type receptor 3 n=1 Tax=Mizuhopecten yessoensis TaxID=6573 RepID=A0A210QSC7_MIZYE|nr:Cadherin EGF LAG seven-pass G-type receptor 3 [Mizuhopecten yessoensis]